MSLLLVLRPEPGASATARAAAALGLEAAVAPLFTIAPVAWEAPDPTGFDALMLTSANAVRHGGPGLDALRTLPAYAVGAATAEAARAAGFAEVRTGAGDAADLLARAAAEGAHRLLHLAGEEHRAATHPGIRIERRIVYRADPAVDLPGAAIDALRRGAIALLHSRRAAACFAELVARAGLARAQIAIAAISPATAGAAGAGWHAVAVADRPADAAVLAAAARLCDQVARGPGRADGGRI